MTENVIKKLFPIQDEKGQLCAFPTFASQVFFEDGSVLEGKTFGAGNEGGKPLDKFAVGGIYHFAIDVNPPEAYGGTWERMTDRFLIGAGGNYTLGDTGGSQEHWHMTQMGFDQSAVAFKNGSGGFQPESEGYFISTDSSYAAASGKYFKTLYTEKTESMPPFEAVNIWKRVA